MFQYRLSTALFAERYPKAATGTSVRIGRRSRPGHLQRMFPRNPPPMMRDIHQELMQFDGWGPFVADQAVVNMRFTPLLAGAADVARSCVNGGLTRPPCVPSGNRRPSRRQSCYFLLAIATRSTNACSASSSPKPDKAYALGVSGLAFTVGDCSTLTIPSDSNVILTDPYVVVGAGRPATGCPFRVMVHIS